MTAAMRIGGTLRPHEHTAGITEEALGPRFSPRKDLLPLDDDEPRECVLCDYRSSYPDLMRTILKNAPDRVSIVCVDHVVCIRRRQGRRAA